MARTAHTIAKGHDGKWKLLATPDESLVEQKRNFRLLRAEKSHDNFSQVIYQESDGHAELIRLLTPEAKQKVDDQAELDKMAADEFTKQSEEKENQKEQVQEVAETHEIKEHLAPFGYESKGVPRKGPKK